MSQPRVVKQESEGKGLMSITGYWEMGFEARLSNLYGLANGGVQFDIWEFVHYGLEVEVGVLPFLRTLDATLYGGMSITFR